MCLGLKRARLYLTLINLRAFETTPIGLCYRVKSKRKWKTFNTEKETASKNVKVFVKYISWIVSFLMLDYGLWSRITYAWKFCVPFSLMFLFLLVIWTLVRVINKGNLLTVTTLQHLVNWVDCMLKLKVKKLINRFGIGVYISSPRLISLYF